MVTCTAARACWVANASLPLELVAIDLVQQRLFWWVETRYLFWCFFVMFMCMKKTVAVRERHGGCFHT